MARKQIRVSRRMMFTWFTLTGLIFLFSPVSLTSRCQFVFNRVFRLPLSIGRNISLSARTRQQLKDKDLIPRDEYERLQNHLANIRQQRDDAHQKVQKLSKMRNEPAWERMGFVLGGVITTSINKSRCELYINRGQNDGLTKGQFVLADNSIVGAISDLDAGTAKVRLFTDPASNIGVRIAGTDRVMRGMGNNMAKIPMVKKSVKLGTEIITSKKPGFLDTPMIIGKVAESRQNDEPLLWDIFVEPVCDLQKITNVVVIVMNPTK